MRTRFAMSLFIITISCTLFAQAPNTATIIVSVVDQSGAAVADAQVSIVNSATAAVRDITSGRDGTATFPALPLTGTYTVSVSKAGFGSEQRSGIELRPGETARLRVTLLVGTQTAEVAVYGTREGVRADPQIGQSISTRQIDELPILGRKLSTIPLTDAAFRPGKGTGDLFTNQTYFVTGAGSRRTVAYVLDGADDDEAWGRQIMLTTVPVGAVQEVSMLTNAFSAEYGWTAGPALNIVTKSGTNNFDGEALYLGRPGNGEAKSFSTSGFCPSSVPSCVTPSTLQAILPVDIPDKLNQFSGTLGGPIVKDKMFFFVSADHTAQDRTTFLSPSLPSFVLQNGDLSYTGQYRQSLIDGRVDDQLTQSQSLFLRANIDRFYDTNPQDTVGGTNAPTVARKYSRASWTAQMNDTWILGPNLLNEARVAYLHGDPVTKWEALDLSTAYTRSGSVPFTIGQSRIADFWGRQQQLSDTLSWSHGNHYVRFGGTYIHHTSGGFGSEFGNAVLGTFTFKSTTTAPFDQLTLADVQQYTQPVSFGIINTRLSQNLYTAFAQDSIRVSNDLTIDAGLRYDRQSLTDAKDNVEPRLGFGWHPGGDPKLAVRGGYAMYYTQIQSNLFASALSGGLDGIATYTAVPGQLGFPTCLTGSCLPVQVDPTTLPASQVPARDITILPGQRAFYEAQFAKYGLDFDKLPDYPDELRNPRSQVMSIGAEREFGRNLFVSSDFVHQRWTGLVRTVDLNAPAPFDRTAPGQTRSVAAANATRPILPVAGGVRQVNVLTNLGDATYNGLQTQITYRGNPKLYASLSYTLSKATNTTEPDGNGVNPNDSNIARLGQQEEGPSVLDQRHRVVLTLMYQFPFDIAAGTVSQYASARPFSATTGIDNNGDGINSDRPVIDGQVAGKSSFRGTPTSEVDAFVEKRIAMRRAPSLVLRLEGFNLFNHGNYLGRGQTVYGDSGTPNPTFGQVAAAGSAANAIPAFANVDQPRMYQFEVRLEF